MQKGDGSNLKPSKLNLEGVVPRCAQLHTALQFRFIEKREDRKLIIAESESVYREREIKSGLKFGSIGFEQVILHWF